MTDHERTSLPGAAPRAEWERLLTHEEYFTVTDPVRVFVERLLAALEKVVAEKATMRDGPPARETQASPATEGPKVVNEADLPKAALEAGPLDDNDASRPVRDAAWQVVRDYREWDTISETAVNTLASALGAYDSPERGEAGPSPEPNMDLVTRVEVIDHRHGAPQTGRAFVAWNVEAALGFQDDGRTLKIFVTDRKAAK